MRRSIIPHGSFVFVGDGRKALFLRNAGDEKFVNLVTEQVFMDDNPATRDQGTDRPGRSFAAAGSVRRSALEPTDWHEIEERRFAERVARVLEGLTRERLPPALAIIAPPRTLAELRARLAPDVRAKVVIEINTDLTGQPVRAIEEHVVDAIARAEPAALH